MEAKILLDVGQKYWYPLRSRHAFAVKYIELVANERIRHTGRFDDENLPVEMCYLGWQESLKQLARLVEPNIPGHG